MHEANIQVVAGEVADDTDEFMLQHEDQVDEAIDTIKQALVVLQLIGEQQQPLPLQQNEAHPTLKRPIDNVGTFKGTHVAWPAFRDLVTALAIKPVYDDIENFLTLQRACKDVDARMIKGYQPVGARFQKAWDSLTKVSKANTQSLRCS